MPDWSEGCGEITQASDSATQLSFLNNPELEMLSVPTVGLTSIDLSKNPKITFLDIIENYLTSIDLSNQTELKEIRIQFNKLKSIDVTKNTKLEILMLLMNDLEGNLDVSTLNNLIELHLIGNENLSCIQVNQQQLDKLNTIGGMKAIVPSEGIVFKYKGKTYKFTGAFAPVNQITGLINF